MHVGAVRVGDGGRRGGDRHARAVLGVGGRVVPGTRREGVNADGVDEDVVAAGSRAVREGQGAALRDARRQVDGDVGCRPGLIARRRDDRRAAARPVQVGDRRGGGGAGRGTGGDPGVDYAPDRDVEGRRHGRVRLRVVPAEAEDQLRGPVGGRAAAQARQTRLGQRTGAPVGIPINPAATDGRAVDRAPRDRPRRDAAGEGAVGDDVGGGVGGHGRVEIDDGRTRGVAEIRAQVAGPDGRQGHAARGAARGRGRAADDGVRIGDPHDVLAGQHAGEEIIAVGVGGVRSENALARIHHTVAVDIVDQLHGDVGKPRIPRRDGSGPVAVGEDPVADRAGLRGIGRRVGDAGERGGAVRGDGDARTDHRASGRVDLLDRIADDVGVAQDVAAALNVGAGVGDAVEDRAGGEIVAGDRGAAQAEQDAGPAIALRIRGEVAPIIRRGDQGAEGRGRRHGATVVAESDPIDLVARPREVLDAEVERAIGERRRAAADARGPDRNAGARAVVCQVGIDNKVGVVDVVVGEQGPVGAHRIAVGVVDQAVGLVDRHGVQDRAECDAADRRRRSGDQRRLTGCGIDAVEAAIHGRDDRAASGVDGGGEQARIGLAGRSVDGDGRLDRGGAEFEVPIAAEGSGARRINRRGDIGPGRLAQEGRRAGPGLALREVAAVDQQVRIRAER